MEAPLLKFILFFGLIATSTSSYTAQKSNQKNAVKLELAFQKPDPIRAHKFLARLHP